MPDPIRPERLAENDATDQAAERITAYIEARAQAAQHQEVPRPNGIARLAEPFNLQLDETDLITVVRGWAVAMQRAVEAETEVGRLTAELAKATSRVAELEAEFTGHIEWTIGALDEDGEPYYLGSYTEAGARHHAAQRTVPHFPVWRRRTNWHHAEASPSHATVPTAEGDPA